MKKVIWLVLALVVLVGCGSQTTTSKEGKFEVTTPMKLEKEEETASTTMGEIVMTMYSGENDDAAYMVNYADYPSDLVTEADAQQVFDGAISSVEGTIVSEKEITLDGHPGREVVVDTTVEDRNATLKMRCYMVESRFYRVMFIGEKGKVKDSEIDEFLDSFKLLK
ncbi:MAG TPA: PsbP-related protein, partial [Aggregatilineaceae bacterium]|nr:PsbP-related protein [Aggregatilineaceae bacterium]